MNEDFLPYMSPEPLNVQKSKQTLLTKILVSGAEFSYAFAVVTWFLTCVQKCTWQDLSSLIIPKISCTWWLSDQHLSSSTHIEEKSFRVRDCTENTCYLIHFVITHQSGSQFRLISVAYWHKHDIMVFTIDQKAASYAADIILLGFLLRLADLDLHFILKLTDTTDSVNSQ